MCWKLSTVRARTCQVKFTSVYKTMQKKSKRNECMLCFVKLFFVYSSHKSHEVESQRWKKMSCCTINALNWNYISNFWQPDLVDVSTANIWIMFWSIWSTAVCAKLNILCNLIFKILHWTKPADIISAIFATTAFMMFSLLTGLTL